jgi:AraC-like DNA-binding protein
MSQKISWLHTPLFRLALSESDPIRCHQSRIAHQRPKSFDMHYELEFGIVTRGSMERLYQGVTTVIQPGQVWFCNMLEPHGYRVRKAPCEYLVFVLLPSLLAEWPVGHAKGFDWQAFFAASPVERPQVRTLEQRNDMKRIAALSKHDNERALPERSLFLQLRFLEALLTVGKDWKPPAPPSTPSQEDLFGKMSRSIALVLRTKENVTVQQAALACGMGRNRFAGRFRALMGVEFSRFVLRHRLKAAAQGLTGSDRPIKAIAEECGFADVSHLHKHFIAEYGCSPGRFRRLQTK